MDMTTADPLVGTTLDQRYRVEARVASGGMATVYVAHDLRLDRRLACKVMHPSLAEDPTFVRRFINEAHSVAKLSHPNVVQVFDQGTDQGHVYLCMEYVPGRTLRDMLHARGRLAARDALDIIAPVLAALGAAHQAGMIHRDVKPENVLLTEDGLVKVADFGLARAVESQQGMTKTGTLMGTAAYLAPEQIERGTSDARTDVYAAGIMLYELLTGRQPHTGDTPISIAYQHVNEDVPRPSRMVPGIPPEVDTLVTRATERDPRYRPANAGQYLALVLEARNALPAAAGADPARDAATAVVPAAVGPAPGPNDTLVVEAGGLADLRDPDDDLDDDLPPARRGRLDRRHYPMLLVSAVLAVVLVVLGWWFFIGRYEPVPDVVGMGEEEAANVLRDAGLRMEVADSEVYSDSVEPGLIAEVDPAVDDRVLPNDTVTVSLSKGPQTVEMPDVVGQSASDARAALEDQGFTEITEEQTTSHEEPAGTVLSTDPEPGAEADREGEIVLTVAQGFDLPDVVGQNQDQARTTLEDLGLRVSVTEQPSDDVPAGQVISQEPGAGSTASAGDDIALTVSTGPEKIEIPDVTGWKVEDAEKELRELGFEVTVTEILGGDRVVRYSPTGEAEKGTEIQLWVSPFGPGGNGDEGDDGHGNGNGNGRGGDD
ncbi:Stk1 family PASTA domain-containing Ser/Thr kinase [Streptomonospora nanhaiensis]|uniref:Stk1 family PASTA domain-containing Ser/Thr kinase n=1 Tax=Streptomonospora nanhaiensis TaxID=1323731 RepID=UPI001C39084E|nr:Stk1 family PASTA domain-containing Ser/Thr kinase [Streptomonospora nanhaiensis]MBV2362422.1 Stk1 family PASTA domain-containing Ser/Thr kinase [Streptomonospora nanhaiensis]